METKPKGKNAKKKPFKQTRQLINLALNDGWTQVEIAEKCRVHQSVVSGWKKGAKEAAESTLMPLLEIYGHKLRRNSFRVYWALEILKLRNQLSTKWKERSSYLKVFLTQGGRTTNL